MAGPQCPEGRASRGEQQIEVRFESRVRSIQKNYAIRLAEEMNLNIKSFVCLKKGTKGTITLISGPHVHKKSRDQLRVVE